MNNEYSISINTILTKPKWYEEVFTFFFYVDVSSGVNAFIGARMDDSCYCNFC